MTVKVTMTVTLVKLQSTTVTVIVAVFVTVTFIAVRAKKQILNQCIHQLSNNKSKPEVETSQNTVNISVVTVTVVGNVTPATVCDKEEKKKAYI